MKVAFYYPVLDEMNYKIILLLLFCAKFVSAYTEQEYPPENTAITLTENGLLRNLEIVSYWEKMEKNPPPSFYNHLLQMGYFNMPSARVGKSGTVAVGFSWVPPYRNYNLHFQPLERLEISGNYRVFSGVSDVVLSPHGFGDYADKGANVKFSLIQPQDSDYALPGIAVGLEDFHGSKLFESRYLVFTQVWPDFNAETSIGFGNKRINGIFGGFSWLPWYHKRDSALQKLAIVAEYDSTDYERKEPNPHGRKQSSPVNYGLKYRFADYWDFSLSHIRGEELAGSINVSHNLGETKGFLPKIDDPLPYKSPVNTEQLGLIRQKNMLAQDLTFALTEQGFKVLDIILSPDPKDEKKDSLWVKLENKVYREERETHKRISYVLRALLPSNLSKVTVVIESDDLPSHRYDFRNEDLQHYRTGSISKYEHSILSPMKEVTYPPKATREILYHKNKPWTDFSFRPRMASFFGGATGKYKYDLGLAALIKGFLFDDLMYQCQLGYTIASTTDDLRDTDRLNPSQIINIRSDYIRYRQENSFTIDQAFIQKNWYLGNALYSRISGGHFEVAFGGIASELLYYPVGSDWAIGAEAALIRKREYSGLGFQNEVRKLNGFTPTYQEYKGSQYFLDFYYDIPAVNMDLKISAGQFLAFDKGVRTEVSRNFDNGFTVSMWYTVTDAMDMINSERYYDKGVSFSMPLEIFYTNSRKDTWGYGMSAWLRDVGIRSSTGQSLYSTLKNERK
ncbi:MAG: hypothetical protein ACI9S8_000751 [Chlamydiales bacterium]|jgi:hypothetical protein